MKLYSEATDGHSSTFYKSSNPCHFFIDSNNVDLTSHGYEPTITSNTSSGLLGGSPVSFDQSPNTDVIATRTVSLVLLHHLNSSFALDIITTATSSSHNNKCKYGL